MAWKMDTRSLHGRSMAMQGGPAHVVPAAGPGAGSTPAAAYRAASSCAAKRAGLTGCPTSPPAASHTRGGAAQAREPERWLDQGARTARTGASCRLDRRCIRIKSAAGAQRAARPAPPSHARCRRSRALAAAPGLQAYATVHKSSKFRQQPVRRSVLSRHKDSSAPRAPRSTRSCPNETPGAHGARSGAWCPSWRLNQAGRLAS